MSMTPNSFILQQLFDFDTLMWYNLQVAIMKIEKTKNLRKRRKDKWSNLSTS